MYICSGNSNKNEWFYVLSIHLLIAAFPLPDVFFWVLSRIAVLKLSFTCSLSNIILLFCFIRDCSRKTFWKWGNTMIIAQPFILMILVVILWLELKVILIVFDILHHYAIKSYKTFFENFYWTFSYLFFYCIGSTVHYLYWNNEDVLVGILKNNYFEHVHY